ncbi:PfaD family protein [Actinoplanes octamycinicus]|uniref:PfaD family protein n=1 Tax=Actinoplanes octamycinicus TaxID=135948 RepID=A0A7W7GVM1_9ACTN|nr:PfaD family polyunsaturated fatty acid/polyketide biosynthesis protein [Actinoplanes octamycinicus]MBB4739139.1 PfaD family protein [Actinoplanes octamycinicus]GIE58886.1 2-nitropropane dioxygenase [Actinoplanes octamycinicus]
MSGTLYWHGSDVPRFDSAGAREALARLDTACHIVRDARGTGVVTGGSAATSGDLELLASAPPLPPDRLGSPQFRAAHGLRYAYMGGAMAGGIASEEMVVALARAGMLGSFGAAGLLPERIEKALQFFVREIPGLPYACNLIHSPSEEALERNAVSLFLRYGVPCVEASAYLDLSPHIVRYRAAGLRPGPDGRVLIGNRVIAKVSRPELGERFLRPAPEPILAKLVEDGSITAEQAELARRVPVADDLTAEGDSGGHTDRRPLAALLSTLLRVREQVSRDYGYPDAPRIGAAGGIGTPEAAAAAFAMGAAYIVTGSVNQACVESGTSPAVRGLLARADIADCQMAPAADMFEMGVELQVLKRGTMFGMRAKRLYELYRTYDGLHALPDAEREKLERQVFRRPLADVWAETRDYFNRRDPAQVERAEQNPKRQMALVFRWYLGMSSRWAKVGEADRLADYQIWCGPAIGAFNDWTRGSYLAAPENRGVVDVAGQLLTGAAFHLRVAQLRAAGADFVAGATDYRPALAQGEQAPDLALLR